MVNYRREISWLRYIGVVCVFVTLSLGFAPQTRAQTSDPNAPYKDVYEVQTRGRLVGEEPHRHGETHPDTETLRISDRGNRNMIVMSTDTVPEGLFPAILNVPLVSHEFGHVFALPHSPYADDGAHRTEICATYKNATAANIDGMRIALSGETGWQKSSEHGNAQADAPMRNLMFPCALDPRNEYWIDDAQYNWLVEKMPEMLGAIRSQHAQILTWPETRIAQQAGSLDGMLWQARFQNHAEEPAEHWLMLTGLVDGNEATLLPAIGVPSARKALSGVGPHEIQVEDAAGRTIARAPVGPGTDSGDVWPFSVTVPISTEPSRIVLVNDGAILAEMRASPALTAPDVTSHRPGDVYRADDILEWAEGSAG